MKIKGRLYILILLLTLTILTGCAREDAARSEEDDNSQINQPVEVNNEKKEKLEIQELQGILMESLGIELKNTENQAVGMLKDRERILAFVEEIFSYPLQEAYPGDSNENTVIGPINFYGSGGNDIYGLIKRDYIYVEGYYFLLDRGKLDNIEKLFKQNIIQAPISGN